MRFYGFTGMIDDDGVTRIAAAFNDAINNRVDEVHLCFSSLGGYVHSGIFLYNFIRGLPIKFVAYNGGSVASIAVAIFLAAQERYSSEHGVFMIHPTSMSPQAGMTATHLQSTLDSALADEERTENILRERANVPESVLTDRRAKDVYITPADAVTYGLVDAVREFALPKGHQIFQI
ncbi:ATP-dependent Clp protease proteolytic subunit [Qipengyuania sp.]|uniref:ATP-dependent Clp protease proteolytic subunit n=1 Tax=Qipengyuania sp. TaxID=2004515 RepID=UPI003516B5C6